MGDNTVLNPGVGGDTVADEDVAGVKYQRVKLVDPSVGSTAPIGNAANPFRTDPTGATAQPITAAALPLPTGAATDGTDGAAPPVIPGTGIRGWLRSIYDKLASSITVTGTFWQATQPISAANLPLPAGASTEATLALIKAKTDNIDVALSTRTKPADVQAVSGTVGVTGIDANLSTRATEATVAAIAAKDFATSAKQDTEYASISSIDAKTGTLESKPSANSVLDRLYQIGVKLDRMATEATLKRLVAIIPTAKINPTLLHRS